jgi:hypothetical protein
MEACKIIKMAYKIRKKKKQSTSLRSIPIFRKLLDGDENCETSFSIFHPSEPDRPILLKFTTKQVMQFLQDLGGMLRMERGECMIWSRANEGADATYEQTIDGTKGYIIALVSAFNQQDVPDAFPTDNATITSFIATFAVDDLVS